MNPSVTFQKYPTTGIKIWIFIGILGVVFMMALPVFIQRMVTTEKQRFIECQKHERTDCQPSSVWALFDLELKTAPKD